MAYQLMAEKHGDTNVAMLRERLAQLDVIEFFPVHVDDRSVALGISIPFKVTEDARFESELIELLSFLIVEQQFVVTDLFTGRAVSSDGIVELPRKIK